jgi:hypothetical protein
MRLSHETVGPTGAFFAGKELHHEEEDIRHQGEVSSTQRRRQVAWLAREFFIFAKEEPPSEAAFPF